MKDILRDNLRYLTVVVVGSNEEGSRYRWGNDLTITFVKNIYVSILLLNLVLRQIISNRHRGS